MYRFTLNGTSLTNVARRGKQHGDRFDEIKPITPEPLTRNQALAIEQAMHVKNPQFQNINNPISPTGVNEDVYSEALEWGVAWLEKHGF